MKQIIIILGLILPGLNIFSQSQVDALRYSQNYIGGTARYTAMAGAFGALGGDFSSMSHNPAGLAVYRSSEFTFTPEIFVDHTTTNYFGVKNGESKFNLNLNNIGYVSSNEGNGALKYINFGFGYNKLANFNKSYTINADNPNSTYADYMAQDANSYEELWAFGSGMFYEAYVIDWDTLNGNYIVNNDYWFYDEVTEQEVTSNESGKINEFTFSMGMNFSDVFYFGATLGILPLKYYSERITREYDAALRSDQFFEFREKLNVRGTGYTAKFGGILRPIPQLRIGAAYHLPVWYNLSEIYTPTLESWWLPGDVISPRDAGASYNTLSNDYVVVTPSKAIASAAVILGKLLIVSSDLEYIDYSNMKLDNEYDDFNNENELIKQIYSNAINAKLGAEFRMDGLYFRGGFAYFGSPYGNTEVNFDADRYNISAGFGIRDESFFFDIAVQRTYYEERQIQYSAYVWDELYEPAANLNTKNYRILTTFGFRF